MIDRELAAKIRRIRIGTGRKVNSIFAGEYVSAFKGQGMEFEEVRAYQPGDDVKSIDWNVTARTGHPYIKRYREERELTVLLMVDLSASGDFGSTGKSRNDVAAEVCALLSFSAIRNNDRVGLLVFTDQVETYIPPSKGVRHVMRIIREILAFKPQSKGTSIETALNHVGTTLKRGSVVFLLSDFRDSGYEKILKTMGEKQDLVALTISDPLETSLPDCGLVTLCDPETEQQMVLDSSSRRVRALWEKAGKKRIVDLSRFFASCGLDHVHLNSCSDWAHTLSLYFMRHQSRISGGRP